MTFEILTLFPKIFDSYFQESIIKRAKTKKLIKINVHNIRDFATNKHKQVDDRPYGGGAGMVLMFEPIHKAIKKIKKKNKKSRVILFSTRGKVFNSKEAKRLATRYDQLIFICGRYEGVDERVAKYLADEEISVGEYVLTGGEIPAMVLVDAISRKVKGVLGKQESLEEIQGSYPTYTRPAEINWKNPKTKKKKVLKVPKVLQTGNHKEIEKWRKEV